GRIMAGGKPCPEKSRAPGQEPGLPSCRCGSRGPALHPSEPGTEILELGVERLADDGAEIEKTEKQDVGERHALACKVVLSGHQLVEPGELVLGNRLEAVCRFRKATHTVLE